MRRTRLLALAALVASVSAYGGDTRGANSAVAVVAGPVAPAPLSQSHDRRARRDGRRPRGRGAILSAADRRSFSRLAARLGGQHGLAVSGAGFAQRVQMLGRLRTGVAWSTAKVPVVMAALAAGRASVQDPDVVAAITASDNAAAMRLWNSLGGGGTAAMATEAQLRAAGDQRTIVESQPLRGARYTPFGQTAWRVSDQARFTAGLACLPQGVEVLTLMGRVVAEQRWGLGDVGAPAQFKGGWGPGTQPGIAGGYLDRQMGVLTLAGRPLVAALATRPADGSHASGTANLTVLAHWLVKHADPQAAPARAGC